jgi:hypothetical protein
MPFYDGRKLESTSSSKNFWKLFEKFLKKFQEFSGSSPPLLLYHLSNGGHPTTFDHLPNLIIVMTFDHHDDRPNGVLPVFFLRLLLSIIIINGGLYLNS